MQDLVSAIHLLFIHSFIIHLFSFICYSFIYYSFIHLFAPALSFPAGVFETSDLGTCLGRGKQIIHTYLTTYLHIALYCTEQHQCVLWADLDPVLALPFPACLLACLLACLARMRMRMRWSREREHNT